MSKSSNYWDKRAIKRLSEAEKSSEIYIKRIKKIYEQAYKNIDKEIASVYKNYSQETGLNTQKLKELLTRSETKKTWEQMKRQGLDKYIKDNYKSRISRLEQIQAQIYAKAKLIYPKEELEQTMCYRGVINNSYYKVIYDTQIGTGYDFSFNKIDNNLVNSILNEKWSGKNYSGRIWGNTDILASNLSQIVGGALLSGQAIERTSKQIRDRFEVSKYYSERLVRTETNHFNNEVDAIAYEKMGIDKYVFVATLDSRTSQICQDMDNKVFEYKDREIGVNFPPLHPNCRSKTRGYLGEEMEKKLKRRARNPITGKTETITNMSYSKWIEKYQNNNLDTKKLNSLENIEKINKNDIIKIDISDFPTELINKKEIENSNILIDYINNSKNADPKVVKVYKSMGKLQNTSFTVSHAKNHSLSYQYNSKTNQLEDVKLTIPNLKGVNNINGTVNTILHEDMHLIDFMSRGTKEYGPYKSMQQETLKDIIRNSDATIGKDVNDLFVKFNNEYKNNRDNIVASYKKVFNELNNTYINSNTMSHKEYSKLYKTLQNELNAEISYTSRNLMGGGINNLQDIYDALSKGKYREIGIVKYGHGPTYYNSLDSRVHEIVANYGALSITRPDLIKLLKADKPKLVEELDNLMDKILEEIGE